MFYWNMVSEHYEDSGVDIIVKLIAENPNYDKYHANLFWMLRKHRAGLRFGSNGTNPLMTTLLVWRLRCQISFPPFVRNAMTNPGLGHPTVSTSAV